MLLQILLWEVRQVSSLYKYQLRPHLYYHFYRRTLCSLSKGQHERYLQKVLQFIAKSILSLGKLTNQKRVDQLPTDQRYNVNIKQSWFIRYNKGGVVFPHYHPECSWACVYYVQIGNEAKIKNGSTFFLRPYSYAGSDFGSKYLRNDTNVFNAEEGKLLIWPSFLYHGSHPYDGEKDRIIISANCTIDLLNQSNK